MDIVVLIEVDSAKLNEFLKILTHKGNRSVLDLHKSTYFSASPVYLILGLLFKSYSRLDDHLQCFSCRLQSLEPDLMPK